jgi:hypothetical protein
VLEALAPGPYFQYIPGEMAGQDLNFCKQARAAGFPILIDPDITVGHLGAVAADRHLHAAWGEVSKIMNATKEAYGGERLFVVLDQ